MNDRDRELSRLFEAERRADEAAAPALDAVLARSRPPSPGMADALSAVALASSVAALIGASILALRSGASSAGPEPALHPPTTQIAEWRSPTAFLLDTPGSELLTEVPTLSTGSFAQAGDAAAPQPTKGVAR